MTDFTTLTDTQVATNKPITQSMLRAFRDNPVAITEGAAGAPKIQTAAIADNAVTGAKFADNSVTMTKHIGPTAGGTYTLWQRSPDGVEFTTKAAAPTSEGTSPGLVAMVAGIIRVSVDLQGALSSSNIAVYKNGVSVATLTHSSTWATKTVDISVAASDRINLIAYTGNTQYDAFSRNLKITSGTPSLVLR